METRFKTIAPDSVSDNLIKLIGGDWMLIAAGRSGDFNTMTASWGAAGVLWNKPIAVCFIRPQRYTFQFTEKYSHYTLSFFDGQYREILDYCGTHSGRDIDKVRQTGLLPLETANGNIAFSQARLVLECQKFYSDVLKPDCFLEKSLLHLHYPKGDFHRFYIGWIEKCYIQARPTGS